MYSHLVPQEKVNNSLPYQHEIIVDIIHDAFFKGRRSVHTLPRSDFNVKWQGEVHKELPVSMVALVATAVRLSVPLMSILLILELQVFCALLNEGVSETMNFQADTFAPTYLAHVEAMNSVYKSRPRAYHTMLERLYDMAT